MNLLHVVILSIIEGITEFLPVSSTAHLLLASRALGIVQTAFTESFVIGIQVGAIAAVAIRYARRYLTDWETDKRVIAAFLPTAVIGFILYKLVKGYLLGNPWVSVIALAVGGAALILFERLRTKAPAKITDIKTMPYGTAVGIGLCQSLAVVPGVSRSAATIVGGMALGVEKNAIVEFSFLLAVPTMVAATGYDLLKTGGSFTQPEWGMLAIGCVLSGIFAWISVTFLLNYVKKHSFSVFGIYRIVLALAAWALLVR